MLAITYALVTVWLLHFLLVILHCTSDTISDEKTKPNATSQTDESLLMQMTPL